MFSRQRGLRDIKVGSVEQTDIRRGTSACNQTYRISDHKFSCRQRPPFSVPEYRQGSIRGADNAISGAFCPQFLDKTQNPTHHDHAEHDQRGHAVAHCALFLKNINTE